MLIQRYDLVLNRETFSEVEESEYGEYVLYTDYFNAIMKKNKKIVELQSLIVTGFYEEGIPSFHQGVPTHELESIVTAEECNGYVQKIFSRLDKEKGDI